MTRIGTTTVLDSRGVKLPGGTRAGKRRTVAPVTEKAFMAQVVALAKLRGWMVYHSHDSRQCEPGFPDLVMVRGERLIFAELKRDGERPTEAQRVWMLALGKAADCRLWRPLDWELIERELSWLPRG